MRLRTGLTALAIAASAAVIVTTGSAAPAGAAETCFGLAPTITAPSGTETVRGTAGNDVIVTRGVRVVSALGGDDTLCLEGAQWVDAGEGDDRVQSRTREGRHHVVLGAGSDLFEGSDGRDQVHAENFDGEDPYPGEGLHNTDTVRTHGGRDRVVSGASTQPNSDRVDLGAGDDSLLLRSAAGGAAMLVGGPGRDGVRVSFDNDTAAVLSVDLAAGTATMDGAPFAALGGFADVSVDAYGSAVTVRGTGGANRVFVGGRATVDAGAGRDTISLFGDLDAVVGGPGRDEVEVTGYGDRGDEAVVYDLRRRLFTRGDSTARFETERLRVSGTGGRREDVRVLGTPRRDVVTVGACGAVVRGGGGRDRLDSRSEQCGGVVTTLVGGGGNDRLLGGEDRDVLLGGPGRDLADGGDRRDRCRAEVERRCELG